MKKRNRKLMALLTAISLCAGTVYAEGSTEEVQSELTQTEAVMAAAEASTEAAVAPAAETETETETAVAPAAETETETVVTPSAETTTEAATEQAAEPATEQTTESPSEAVTEKTEAETPAEKMTETLSETSKEIETEKETEKGTEIDTEKDTESEEEKPREQLTVKDDTGTVLSMKEIVAPAKLTCRELTCPADYEEGVYRVQVPEDTQTLQITVTDQEDGEIISLTKWNGYLAEIDETWFLCPDDPMQDSFSAEGNIYTVKLENYMLDMERITLEQLAVYGTLNTDASYAEIFVYSEERSEVLLVEFLTEELAEETQTEETQTGEISGNSNQKTPDTETDIESNAENKIENSTENMTEYAAAESETNLYMEEEAVEDIRTLAASASDIEKSYQSAGSNLASTAEKYTPTVQSINGEWQILGLVRSGQEVDKDLYSKYLENVTTTMKENDGILHKKKYTEYSRVVLALTALGEDVTDVGGYNLLQPLADFDQTVWQGVNGAIFALLAFDSHDYEIPTAAAGKTQTTRVKLINHILSLEVAGGGWDLSGSSADADMTGMAIQALAPYYNSNETVKAAVDRAVNKLSSMQNSDGGFGSYGTDSSESCAQVIVALTALGIDPNTDPRFVKNGNSVVDALLTFQKKNGSFAHTSGGSSDQMATEQAYYALTSYQRFQSGKTSLYDMSDIALKSDYKKAENTTNLIKALPDTITKDMQAQVQEALSSYNGLTELQKTLLTEETYGKLQTAVKALEELQVELESEEQTETDTEEETEAITEKTPESENAEGEDKKQEDKGQGNKNQGNKNQESGKKPTASNKKPTGTTKKVNLVSSSNRTGSTSSGNAGNGTGSTGGSKKTTESETESETEIETTSESGTGKLFGKKNGGTQIPQEVRDVVAGMEELLDSTGTMAGSSEEDLDSEYTDLQIDSILEVYREYESLSDPEKELVRNDKSYEGWTSVLDKLKEANHYDEATDTDLRENEEEILPWYVHVEVTPMLVEENTEAAVREALKGQGALLTLADIHLTNLLEGGVWQPEDLIRVRIAETGKESFENLAVIHMKEDGSMEFIDAYISGDYLEFDTDHFSRFGIVGYNGSMEDLMEEQEEENIWLYLIPGAGAAVLLLMMLLIRAVGAGKKKGVKKSER